MRSLEKDREKKERMNSLWIVSLIVWVSNNTLNRPNFLKLNKCTQFGSAKMGLLDVEQGRMHLTTCRTCFIWCCAWHMPNMGKGLEVEYSCITKGNVECEAMIESGS